MEGFEEFTGYWRKAIKEPEVTIKKSGEFSLNERAFKALGEPVSVKLLYHPDKRLIAFRPDGDTPVRQRGKSMVYQVAGRAFTKHYGIDVSVAKKYKGSMQEDMLIIDLNEASD
jgi:hypothetical protein